MYLQSAYKVVGAVERTRTRIQRTGVCDGRIGEGSLQCNFNVSLVPIIGAAPSTAREDSPLRTGRRMGVKNLNSLWQIFAVTEVEVLRQALLAPMDARTGQ